MSAHISVSMTDQSRISEARRAAIEIARAAGMDDSDTGRVAIVATELATNLLKHAVKGELLTGALECGGVPAVEIVAVDEGPGMSNLNACLRDGYSTGSSPGTGLGAIARLTSDFDVYTQPGKGSAFLARIQANSQHRAHSKPPMDIAAISVAKSGEQVCGDACAVHHQRELSKYLVVDGLGHGMQAADVAIAAVEVFKKHTKLAPAAMMESMHRALQSTRGGAAAVAEIDFAQGVVRFAGVGNIAGAVVGPDESRHLVSNNGIVGHDIRQIREFSYPWIKDGILVMHSDGLGTRWSLKAYGGLRQRSPGLIAGVLYRDFARRRDDITILVAKATEEGK